MIKPEDIKIGTKIVFEMDNAFCIDIVTDIIDGIVFASIDQPNKAYKKVMKNNHITLDIDMLIISEHHTLYDEYMIKKQIKEFLE